MAGFLSVPTQILGSFLPYFLIGGILILFLFSFLFWLRYILVGRGRTARALNLTLFQVLVPRQARVTFGGQKEGQPKDDKESISITEHFLSSLTAIYEKGFKTFLYGQPVFAFEIAANKRGEILFFVAVPRRYKSYVEKQIHAYYPKAQVREALEDYTIFDPDDFVEMGGFRLKKQNYYPLQTYHGMQGDPLSSLVSELSKLEKGNSAVIQLILHSVSPKWSKAGLDVARQMQAGEKGKGILGKTSSVAGETAHEVISTFPLFEETAGRKPEETEHRAYPTLTPLQQETIKAIETKSSKPAFRANLRVIVASRKESSAKHILKNILNAFSQYNTVELNRLEKVKIVFRKKFLYDYVFRNFNPTNASIFNTEEITSIFHFPLPSTETPGIVWLEAEKAAAPVELPTEGIVLGINVYRDVERMVKITEEDRRRHLYMIGQTGTGKTTLFLNMIAQDIANGEGVAYIDPHGEAIEKILTFIPSERAEDVILFDPGDVEYPIGLNLLEWKTPEQMDFAVAEMIRIFEKLFPPEVIGPMFEHNMRNAMLTLMADKENPGTIVEIPKIFTDTAFMQEKLRHVTDPTVRDFWEAEEAKTTEFHKSEKLGYIISKVGRFVENKMMRNIIGQPHSGFDFRDAMDTRKILLINLSKGKTGEVNSSLLGLICVTKLQMAAMSRVNVPESQRRDFYLYIDEFQNFITESISTILSEARKYKLCLNMTHQFIGQLTDEIRDAVFGNVGTVISFRAGPEDAEFLEKQFEPVFTRHDLINIDFANAYVRLLINNTPSVPFSMKTPPPPEGGDPKMAEAVRTLSRSKYGRSRAEVEQEIAKHLSLGKKTGTMVPGESNR